MADKAERTIKITLAAQDNASAIFSQAERNARKFAKSLDAAATVRAPATESAPVPREPAEQEVRRQVREQEVGGGVRAATVPRPGEAAESIRAEQARQAEAVRETGEKRISEAVAQERLYGERVSKEAAASEKKIAAARTPIAAPGQPTAVEPRTADTLAARQAAVRARSEDEQIRREVKAIELEKLRAESQKSQRNERAKDVVGGVRAELFGKPEDAARPIKARFSAEEQAIRDEQARLTKEIRANAQKAMVESIAQERVYGDRVGKEAEKSGRKIAESRASGEGAARPPAEKTGLAGIKEQLGEERTLKGILQGGAAGFAGEQLAKLSEKALELQKAFADDDKSVQTITNDLLEGLPILGGFVTAAQNFKGMLDGSAAKYEAYIESVKRGREVDEAVFAQREAARVADIAHLETIKSLEQQIRAVGLSGRDQSREQIQQDRENAIAAVKRRNDEAHRARNESSAKELIALNDTIGKGKGESHFYDSYDTIENRSAAESAKRQKSEVLDAMKAANAKEQQAERDEIARINDLARKREDENRYQYELKELADEQAFQDKRKEASLASEQSLAAAKAEMRQADLRDHQQFLAADLDAIHTAAENEKAALDRELEQKKEATKRALALEEEHRKHGPRAPEVVQQDTDAILHAQQEEQDAAKSVPERKAAIDARAKQKEGETTKADTEQGLDKRIDAEKRLSQFRLDALDAQGRAGDKAAEVEAKRLRVAQDFAAKEEEVRKILADQTLSAEQRAEAAKLLSDLPRQQLLADQEAQKVNQNKLAASASGQDAGALTGIADMISQKNQTTDFEKQNADNAKATAENTKAAAQNMKDLLELIRLRLPATPPVYTGS